MRSERKWVSNRSGRNEDDGNPLIPWKKAHLFCLTFRNNLFVTIPSYPSFSFKPIPIHALFERMGGRGWGLLAQRIKRRLTVKVSPQTAMPFIEK
jgi:hypothetical protein